MAVVHSADGVRFVATAADPDALDAQVAGYVRERCDYVLWRFSAARVRALLDAGNARAAIALYFASVGERWDEERLELSGLGD